MPSDTAPDIGPGGRAMALPECPRTITEAGLSFVSVAQNIERAQNMKPKDYSKDTDMVDQPVASQDQEPGQILSSSPPFPRYTRYNELATAAATGGGQPEPDRRLASVGGQEPSAPASLPMRPAPIKTATFPPRHTGSQEANKADSNPAGWVLSSAGRKFMAKHQLQLPPTQLLSLECQKRKFNPAFEIKQDGLQTFQCTVTIQDKIVRSRARYHSAAAAKQYAALEAWKLVRTWPLPKASLYFVAQFTGQISEDNVHSKLRQVLNGRRYSLSILRYPGMSGGFLLLQIPGDQGFPTSFIRLSGELDSVVFANIKKSDHCNLCAKTSLPPHQRVQCPLWRPSPALPARLEPDNQKQGHQPQYPVKAEPKYYAPSARNNTPITQDIYGPFDKRDQLIRCIQREMGTAATSSESKDPRVKAAFLEGIALGARLAVSVPGNNADRDRRRSRSRSRSPRGRQPRGTDRWTPSGYRVRTPLAQSRDRQASPEPLIDRGVDRHSASYGAGDSHRGRRRGSDHYVAQGASHWGNDMYFP